MPQVSKSTLKVGESTFTFMGTELVWSEILTCAVFSFTYNEQGEGRDLVLQDLTFIGINVVSMVNDDNEINIEGEAGGLGWLPSHNPFHLEQIQRCE